MLVLELKKTDRISEFDASPLSNLNRNRDNCTKTSAMLVQALKMPLLFLCP